MNDINYKMANELLVYIEGKMSHLTSMYAHLRSGIIAGMFDDERINSDLEYINNIIEHEKWNDIKIFNNPNHNFKSFNDIKIPLPQIEKLPKSFNKLLNYELDDWSNWRLKLNIIKNELNNNFFIKGGFKGEL